MINTLRPIIKAWISCYSRGRTIAAKMPGFPMVVFQRERRSVSHFCVFMADLNYGIRFAPNRTNCQLSWPTLPYRPLLYLGSSVTQSIPEFLVLRLDSFLPYGERESRQVWKNKQTFRTKSVFFFFPFVFSPNRKQRKCCRQPRFVNEAQLTNRAGLGL